MINKRVGTVFQIKYILSVWAVNTAVFMIWWQLNQPVAGTFLGGIPMLFWVFIPSALAGMLTHLFIREREVGWQIMDKPINASKIDFFSKKLETHAAYYPAAKVSVTPIFSVFAVVNIVVASCVVPFVVVAVLMTFNPLSVLGLALTSITVSWLVLVVINIIATIKVNQQKANSYRSMRTVNMDYSYDMLADICKTQVERNFVGDWSDRKDIMLALAEKAVETGFLANDLIMEGVVDAEIIEGEIKIIEHSLNSFIPNTISTTNDFFKANKKNKAAAHRIYEKELEPKIVSEATKLSMTIGKIWKRLGDASDKAVAELRKNQDALINIDKVLLSLSEDAGIPVPTFPEFTELNFSSDQKRVAAKNIITNSLKTLNDAKNKVTSSDDKQKLDRQINKVKSFVRSLASNTPESAAREERLRAAIKTDPLFLGTDIGEFDDIDNTIAINERYLDSYDRSLPISKK